MAERAGFEPAIPIARDNGFRDRRLQPLGHLSAIQDARRSPIIAEILISFYGRGRSRGGARRFRRPGCRRAISGRWLRPREGERHDRGNGAGLGIGGAEDEAAEAGLDEGAEAHGAGLDGDIEVAVGQAVVPGFPGRLAKGDDLGVGRGVGAPDGPVRAAGDDPALPGRRRRRQAPLPLAAALAASASAAFMNSTSSMATGFYPESRPAQSRMSRLGPVARLGPGPARFGL